MSKEIRARIEKASYQTFLDRTEVTLSLPGEHDLVRGELVVLVVSEGTPPENPAARAMKEKTC
ncbi:hypothetical protein ACIGB6_10110 [Paeniglutamicibacter gangotriensis]|uniref:hypothetical protein n=1 Tax=Paeniglutamicibacter gangotriensis TaxID=254787 RepID=UPI0037C5F4D9